MRYLTLKLFSVLMMSAVVLASVPNTQLQNSAQEKVAHLSAQLSEVESKQAGLQTRLQELDEKLKPENIEKALAGVGSTRPEDLREQRRRQLEIERNGVRAQLDILAASHSRLETAIAKADAEAYRQSAQPIATTSVESASVSDSAAAAIAPQRPRRPKKKKPRKARRSQQTQGY